MFARHLLVLALAPLLLNACVITTPPPPPPPQQTTAATGSHSGPTVPGTPAGQTGKQTLTATVKDVTMTIGEKRVMSDLLRNEKGLAPGGGLLWLSSDTKVATVNPLTGQLDTLAPGTTVLTASLQAMPSVQVQLAVTVTNAGKVVQIRIEPGNPRLAVGETLKLTAVVQLADGTVNGNVDWSSGDNTVAIVNPTNGEVTALKPGQVTIKGAYSLDQSQFGVSSVTVLDAAATP